MIRIFKHYIPKALIFLAIAEGGLLALADYLGIYIRFVELGEIGDTEGMSPLLPKLAVFVLVIMGCMMAMGLYQRHLRDGPRGMFLRLVISFGLAVVLMTFLFYLFPDLFVGRGAFGISLVLGFVFVTLARVAYVKFVDVENLKRRVLVVGAGKKATLIDSYFKRRTDRRGFSIVGYLEVPGEEQEVADKQVLRLDSTLVDYVQSHDIDELVIAISDRRNRFPVDEILDCKMAGIDVIDLQGFFERQSGRLLLGILQPSWLIFSDGFGRGAFRQVSKRGFDLLASTLLLTLTLPVMLVTMLLIWLEDRGPVFYRQVRVGQNWKLFQVIKFRSMRVDAEKDGKPQWAKQDDDRVTRVGRFIRKTRIDELPQLFNVLKGEMSFVGPRPERPEFVEKFSTDIPYYSERHRVKPGITGWAQISYPYGSSERDTIEKLQYDLYYVKNYSLFLDLTVLLQTAEVILWGRGAR